MGGSGGGGGGTHTHTQKHTQERTHECCTYPLATCPIVVFPWNAKIYRNQIGQCKDLMYSKKGVVYKLHAGRLINCSPVELINCSLSSKVKGLLCGNRTERGKA